MYSVRYYPRFHTTAVGLGTYYPWIRCSTVLERPKAILPGEFAVKLTDPNKTGKVDLSKNGGGGKEWYLKK
jgi:hypothetical protein